MSWTAADAGRSRIIGAISTRARVAVSFLALALVVVALMGLLAGQAARQEVERGIGERLHELAQGLAERLESDLAEREREIRNLVAVAEGQALGLEGAAWRPVVDQLQRSFTHYAWIGLADADGRVRAATGGLLEGRNVSQRPWFAQALKRPFVGDVHEARLLAALLPPEADGEPMRLLDVAAPLRDEAGRTTAVLGAHLSLRWAEEQRARLLRPQLAERGVEVLVFDRGGNLLLGPPGSAGLRLPTDVAATLGRRSHAVADWLDAHGRPRPMLTAVAEVRGRRADDALGWHVVLRQPLDEALQPARALQHHIWLVGGGAAAVFAGISWLLSGWLTAPLTRLAQRAREALDGSSATGLQPTPQAGPGAGVAGPRAATAGWEGEGGREDPRSPEAGQDRQDAGHRAGAASQVADEAGQDTSEDGNQAGGALAGGAPAAGGAELRELDASLAELVRRLRGREAELLALNASLETRVEQRTAALEQALRELRGFSRMVAHDLRGPLLSVAQLLRLAQAQCDEAGAGDAAGLVGIGAAECERLGHLVQELLQLAQVDQQPLRRQVVDMRTLVEEAWAGLVPPPGRLLPQLHLHPLPPVHGDAVLLRQVWTNLLANAVKFSAKVDEPQVWVQARAATPADLTLLGEAADRAAATGAARASGAPDASPRPAGAQDGQAAPAPEPVCGWVYSVRDNGAGFDMAHAERLFTAFERLHRQSDFPGTGLGLSIVQRIVERHGGRVSAEGAVGRGACLSFSLPAAPPG
ncbi:MAG: hypothetical protein HZB72_04730 [Burkholderiales bacterium]|nr:hypothetical protein [Burkholderiales bacterium]